jgi:DNA-binding NarL/FixJ family response regulator
MLIKKMSDLTNMAKRKKPIMELLRQGKDRDEIAQELGLTRGAVRRFFLKYRWNTDNFG